MRIDAALARPRRRMNLTPMIDVVFLLLVFFMMVSRFGTEQGVALDLAGSGGAVWSGPPRLIELRADGVALNGVAMDADTLLAALVPLMAGPDDSVVLRAAEGSDMQGLLTLMDRLHGVGLTRLAVLP